MAQSEAVLRLVVDDRAARRSIAGLEGSIEKLGAGAIALNQGLQLVASTARTIQQAFELAEQAARNMDAVAVFESQNRQIREYSDALDGLIAKADLAKQVNMAEAFGIGGEDFRKGLELARAASIVTGRSFEYMVEQFVTGSARMSKPIIDNLGIMVSAGEANKRYAESLGRTADSLSDAEKQQAFINEVLRKGAPLIERVAEAGGTAADNYDKMNASLKDLGQTVGEGVNPYFSKLAEYLANISGTLGALFGGRVEFDEPSALNPLKFTDLKTDAELTLEVVENFRKQELALAKEIEAIQDRLDRREDTPERTAWLQDRMAELEDMAERARINAETALAALSKKPGDDDKPDPAPGPSPEEIAAAKAYQRQAIRDEEEFGRTLYRLRDEYAQEQIDADKARREEAGLAHIAALEKQHQDVQRNIEANRRLREREHKRYMAMRRKQWREAERETKRRQEKDRRDKEREHNENERREQAHWMRMVNIATSAYQRLTQEAFRHFEDFVAGQTIRLDAIAAGAMKAAGTETIGFGASLLAEGVRNSMSTNGFLLAKSNEQITGGIGLMAAGTAMGGAGAFWAGSIRRGEGEGGAGGLSIGGQPIGGLQPIATGTNTGIRAPNQWPINIAPGAIVLGDFTSAAAGIGNALQRGGRFLLGT